MCTVGLPNQFIKSDSRSRDMENTQYQLWWVKALLLGGGGRKEVYFRPRISGGFVAGEEMKEVHILRPIEYLVAFVVGGGGGGGLVAGVLGSNHGPQKHILTFVIYHNKGRWEGSILGLEYLVAYVVAG